VDAGEARQAAPRALWIFGYGSLMWRPGFDFAEAVPARVEGWRRGFFIYSTHHRGTHARPGLVLGLDRGGACTGLAFRVKDKDRARTLAYLREREQVNGVYREQPIVARLDDGTGRRVEVIAYVVERGHPSYAGKLPLVEQVRLIRAAAGISGPNLHYLVGTVRRLEELGICEPELHRLMALAGPHLTRRAADAGLARAAHGLIGHCVRHRVKAPLMRVGERRRFLHRLRIAEWSPVE
jgi:glutathione-specific gamma-glutamylcyclotransferase